MDSLFKNKPEIYFKFEINSKNELYQITKIISVARLEKNLVYAYANKNELNIFKKLKYKIHVLPHPSDLVKNKMYDIIQTKGGYTWDAYPTYESYEAIMYKFANVYPTICKLDTICILKSKRKLLTARISNFSDSKQKPSFFYCSTIHGNEYEGYVLMLHLIDYLLTHYKQDSLVTKLINNIDIYINPLANPDGTYYTGNNTVNGAIYYNATGYVNLNRNFPDPQNGNHPDGYNWQPETQALMNYASLHHFVMGATFHTGGELVNYPWDTWYPYQHLHADDTWWQRVSRIYADTVHSKIKTDYFTQQDNGITNGASWYPISGGKQDYMNFFQHCRDVTIELKYDYRTYSLPDMWNYNYMSFLRYMEQCIYGFKGVVTDSLSGTPMKALITIENHDKDSSNIYSILPSGNFYRPIYKGTYNITVSAPGYIPKTIKNISIDNDSEYNLDTIPLAKDKEFSIILNNLSEYKVKIFPNPSNGELKIQTSSIIPDGQLKIVNLSGELIFTQNLSGKFSTTIDLSSLSKGLYFISLTTSGGIIHQKILVR